MEDTLAFKIAVCLHDGSVPADPEAHKLCSGLACLITGIRKHIMLEVTADVFVEKCNFRYSVGEVHARWRAHAAKKSLTKLFQEDVCLAVATLREDHSVLYGFDHHTGLRMLLKVDEDSECVFACSRCQAAFKSVVNKERCEASHPKGTGGAATGQTRQSLAALVSFWDGLNFDARRGIMGPEDWFSDERVKTTTGDDLARIVEAVTENTATLRLLRPAEVDPREVVATLDAKAAMGDRISTHWMAAYTAEAHKDLLRILDAEQRDALDRKELKAKKKLDKLKKRLVDNDATFKAFKVGPATGRWEDDE